MDSPLTAKESFNYIESWVNLDTVWIPPATIHTTKILAELYKNIQITGNLVPDAMLAALAIEHGLTLQSADTDFARFPNLKWNDPT